jgi:hypothetical protein
LFYSRSASYQSQSTFASSLSPSHCLIDRELMVHASELQRHNKRHGDTDRGRSSATCQKETSKIPACLASTPLQIRVNSEDVQSNHGDYSTDLTNGFRCDELYIGPASILACQAPFEPDSGELEFPSFFVAQISLAKCEVRSSLRLNYCRPFVS